jgi:hypothetical protein
LRELFTLVKGPAGAGAHQVTRLAGRLVAAIDGTQLAEAGTEAAQVRFLKTHQAERCAGVSDDPDGSHPHGRYPLDP